MTLKEIRTEAWDVAREVGTSDSSRLWTTKEMNRYINRVYRHIARETRCIRDAMTTEVCRISVTPEQDPTIPPTHGFWTGTTTNIVSVNGQDIVLESVSAIESTMILLGDAFPSNVTVTAVDTQTNTVTVTGTISYTEGVTDPQVYIPMRLSRTLYALHPAILDIDEVKWTTKMWALRKVSCTKWQKNPNWEWVYGEPTEYATDYTSGYIALNFRSPMTDVLRLQVKRMPLVDLSADGDIPEIRAHYHDFMINGVLWQMYSKQDAETFDLEKASAYKKRFDADVDEIKQQETILDQRLKCNHAMNGFL